MVEKFRMDLHQIPEIGFNEFKTQEYILNILKNLNCTIYKVKTGVVAYFNASKNNTIALRADIDALPICEQNNVPYKSKNDGFMHACGHDGHTAMLLEACIYISENLNTIKNNVLAIFQPSEEISGGSNSIIASNLLDKYNIKYIYGFHLWPGLEYGKIFSRKKELMAKSGEVNIEIIGKSVHAANSEYGIDALRISTEYLNDLYKMEEEIPQDVFRLLKFGKMTSGTIRNIISGKTIIEGTMRAFSNETFNYMKNKLYEIALKYQEKYKCEIKISINEGYEPVVNDEDAFNAVDNLIELKKPVMQAEDFGNYLTKYKGCFMFIGLGNVPQLHTNTFDFNMDVLKVGVKAYIDIVNKEYK